MSEQDDRERDNYERQQQANYEAERDAAEESAKEPRLWACNFCGVTAPWPSETGGHRGCGGDVIEIVPPSDQLDASAARQEEAIRLRQLQDELASLNRAHAGKHASLLNEMQEVGRLREEIGRLEQERVRQRDYANSNGAIAVDENQRANWAEWKILELAAEIRSLRETRQENKEGEDDHARR